MARQWQDRKEAIVAAKQLSDLGDAAEDENGDGKVLTIGKMFLLFFFFSFVLMDCPDVLQST